MKKVSTLVKSLASSSSSLAVRTTQPSFTNLVLNAVNQEDTKYLASAIAAHIETRSANPPAPSSYAPSRKSSLGGASKKSSKSSKKSVGGSSKQRRQTLEKIEKNYTNANGGVLSGMMDYHLDFKETVSIGTSKDVQVRCWL